MNFSRLLVRSTASYFIVAVFLFFAGVALAQNPDGALAGTIRDSSGARVAGAQVSLVGSGPELGRSTTSNGLGEFRLEALRPGDYQLEVTAARFAATHSAVKIAVGSVATVAIVLKPEVARQSVQVEARGESVTSQTIDSVDFLCGNSKRLNKWIRYKFNIPTAFVAFTARILNHIMPDRGSARDTNHIFHKITIGIS